MRGSAPLPVAGLSIPVIVHKLSNRVLYKKWRMTPFFCIVGGARGIMPLAGGPGNSVPRKASAFKKLFHSHTFSQITGLINILTQKIGHFIAKQL